MISRLFNAIDKLVITREILLMAGIFVNGSRSKLGAVLPLLQKAGLDKCTEVFILNKSECKLIQVDTVSSAPPVRPEKRRIPPPEPEYDSLSEDYEKKAEAIDLQASSNDELDLDFD